jgi:small-conductance mechanosensitive channel
MRAVQEVGLCVLLVLVEVAILVVLAAPRWAGGRVRSLVRRMLGRPAEKHARASAPVVGHSGNGSAPAHPEYVRSQRWRRYTWRDVALARQLSRRAVRRARIESLVLLPLLAGAIVIYDYRDALFGPAWSTPVRIVTAIALASLGWQFARDVGRALGPTLFRRLEPPTAGTVGFLIRLVTLLVALAIALRISGLGPRELALGGAVTAVVVGLAAQQTLGNLIAGMVLLSARTFRVGERVRLQGGPLAGAVEGIVKSLGLLYTTLASGEDAIMVPNSVVLNVAVVPLREPAGINVRARLRRNVTPSEVEEQLRRTITTPMRGSPRILLEEIDGDEVVVRIIATPQHPADGAKLTSDVLAAIAAHTAHAEA